MSKKKLSKQSFLSLVIVLIVAVIALLIINYQVQQTNTDQELLMPASANFNKMMVKPTTHKTYRR